MRYFNALGLGAEHVMAQEQAADEYLHRHGLIVLECPACHVAIRVPESRPVCRHCGHLAVLDEDGYYS